MVLINKANEVSRASVNFPLKQAEIESSDKVDIEGLIQDIYKAGYSAKVHIDEEEERSKYPKFLIPTISLLLTIGVSNLMSRGYESQANLLGLMIIIVFGRKFHFSSFKNIKCYLMKNL